MAGHSPRGGCLVDGAGRAGRVPRSPAGGVPRRCSARIASRCRVAAAGSPVASCSSRSRSSEITCMPAMKLPRPSASCGMRACAAHASSSGESRPAVRRPIASCMAAASVSPGAAATVSAGTADTGAAGAADTAAACVRPDAVDTADARVKLVPVARACRAPPRFRRRRGRQQRMRPRAFCIASSRVSLPSWLSAHIPGNTGPAPGPFIAGVSVASRRWPPRRGPEREWRPRPGRPGR